MSQRDRFEALVEKKMDEIKGALIEVFAADGHRIAVLQGTYKGLNLAMELYRQAARIDIDPDEGPV